MTELERRALLGDKQAQEECTEKGILLPCPFCGGAAMIEYGDIMPFEYSVFCGDCGVMPSTSEDKQVAVSVWNTRQAPPIGRCGECKHSTYDEEYGNRWCNLNLGSRIVGENDYCGHFKQKEREENAVD